MSDDTIELTDGTRIPNRSRDVVEEKLRPGECDWQTEAGNARAPRYCGAPVTEDGWCSWHNAYEQA